MGRKRTKRGQGSIYERNGLWWCDYSVDGVRKRESCQTANRDEALAYLHRKQGKLASGELLTPDRVSVRDLLNLLLEDYEVRKGCTGVHRDTQSQSDSLSETRRHQSHEAKQRTNQGIY
jgi:hypothetical protein